MLDTSALSETIADTTLKLEGEYPEGRIRSVALVVEVDDGDLPTKWAVYGDDRTWLLRVILEMGLGQIDSECAEVEDRDD